MTSWAKIILNSLNMKPAFLALVFLSSFQGCVPTYINKSALTTIYVSSNSSEITHIKSLFIIASGNMSSRVVSSNLFTALNKVMEKNGSKGIFEFNSTFRAREKVGVEKLETNLYDACMLLSPKDTASIDTKTKYVFAAPLSSTSAVYGSGIGRAYEDSFMVEIYNSQKQLIYKGEISFHFDPT